MVVDFFRCSRCNLTYRENTNGLPCADDGEFHDWIDMRKQEEAAKQVGEEVPREEWRMSYGEIALDIARTVEVKQQQYGKSFQKIPEILKIMYPDGIAVSQYARLALQIRRLDKEMRVAAGNQGNESAAFDIAGYCLLALKDGL
jgi:hypothetical protein